jgi:hypothetical protein
MNPTESKLEEVLQGRDDELEVVKKDDSKATDDSQTNDDDTQITADDGSKADGDQGGDDSDNGFTANDVEPTAEEEAEPAAPTPPAQVDPELKYIADNLPQIAVRVKVGDEVKVLEVKSFTQLPQNVEFASENDRLQFINAMQAQENRAQQLQLQYRNQLQQTQTKEFEVRENAAIRQDITELQESNLLPKFKVQPDDPKFSDDSATKEVQKVLDFMNKKNQEYLDGYNNGRAYRHIGFTEAYWMMPETHQRSAQRVAQKQEDDARKKVADKVAPPTGLSNTNIRKATVRRGTTLDDIVNRYEQEL